MSQQRFAFCIGANGPKTTDTLNTELDSLTYAEQDAKRFAEALKVWPCAFKSTKSIVAAHRKETLESLGTFLKQCECQREDLVIVHFAGHGINDGGLFLVCNNTNLDDIEANAIEIGALKRKLDNCNAGLKILILDCCYAGRALARSWERGSKELEESLKTALQGSADLIICACSEHEKTRELVVDNFFDNGAGFLSGCFIAACTTHLAQVSSGTNAISIQMIWNWMLDQRERLNSSLSDSKKLSKPEIWGKWQREMDNIWLTEPPSNWHEETHSKELEQVYQPQNRLPETRHCPICDQINKAENRYCSNCGDPMDDLPILWLRKALTDFKNGRFRDALRAYEGLRRLKNNDATALFGRGNSLWQLQEESEARKFYRFTFKMKYLDSINRTAMSCTNGIALCDDDEPELALRAFQLALTYEDRLVFPLVHCCKSIAYVQQKKYPDAKKALDEAFGLEHFALAYHNKGIIHFHQEQDREALICFEYAIEHNSRFAAAWHCKGRVLKKLGLLAEAEDALNTAKLYGYRL